jgi:Transglutaminase-like superfamily
VVLVLLRVCSVKRVYTGMAALSRPERRARRARLTPVRAREISGLVAIASRHTLARPTCLHRSLTLWWLLRRRGFDCSLKLGTRKRDGRFEAHAWIEQGGIVINDDADTDRRYSPLAWTP